MESIASVPIVSFPSGPPLRFLSPLGGLVLAEYLWMLAAFYLVIDVVGLKFWTWPLIVVGMNSIVVYVMAQSMKGWVMVSVGGWRQEEDLQGWLSLGRNFARSLPPK